MSLKWKPQPAGGGYALAVWEGLLLCSVRRPENEPHPWPTWEAPGSQQACKRVCAVITVSVVKGLVQGPGALGSMAAKQVSRWKRALSSHGAG